MVIDCYNKKINIASSIFIFFINGGYLKVVSRSKYLCLSTCL